jgi:hypothetical protein
MFYGPLGERPSVIAFFVATDFFLNYTYNRCPPVRGIYIHGRAAEKHA